MDCRTNCPKVLAYEQTKQGLITEFDKIDSLDQQVSSASQQNRATRRQIARMSKKSPGAHEAMRSLSDAEFVCSEAVAANAEARVKLQEAIEAQDVVIDILTSTCESARPVVANENGQEVFICTNDILDD